MGEAITIGSIDTTVVTTFPSPALGLLGTDLAVEVWCAISLAKAEAIPSQRFETAPPCAGFV